MNPVIERILSDLSRADDEVQRQKRLAQAYDLEAGNVPASGGSDGRVPAVVAVPCRACDIERKGKLFVPESEHACWLKGVA